MKEMHVIKLGRLRAAPAQWHASCVSYLHSSNRLVLRPSIKDSGCLCSLRLDKHPDG